MLRKLAVGIAIAVLGVGAAQAQTNGTFGSSSTGTFSVNATVDPVVRISGLNNLTFAIGASFLNGSNPNVNQDFDYCVYSNVSSLGSYKLSVSGTPGPAFGSNAWLLQGAGTDVLPFYVNSDDGTTERQMGPTDEFDFIAAGEGVRPDTSDCSDTGENTEITVAIKRSDILAANAGSYAATVTVTASVL
jgi:spore coat protein U-like protein